MTGCATSGESASRISLRSCGLQASRPSSPRTRGPITPGFGRKGRHQPHCSNRNDTAYGSSRSRGRRDVSHHSRDRLLPEVFHFVCGLFEKRARGRPGARCTRGLMCQKVHALVHMSIQVQRKHSGLPCAMALRLIRALPGDLDFLVTVTSVMPGHYRRLDANPGASGPHAFAVRECLIRPRFRA
jgi:hypothetical protein